MVPPLEKLVDAPIDEVACGFVFTQVAALDPLFIGGYWKGRQGEFRSRELRPALLEAPATGIPLRALLVSKDDQYVTQVQADRFYLNWRRRSDGYPRFTTRDEKEGVLARALREFAQFSAYCAAELGTPLATTGIELVKIDLLREGRYWNGLGDLADMLPWLTDFAKFSDSGAPAVALAFEEPRGPRTLVVSLVLGSENRPDGSSQRALRIESRIRGPATEGALEDAFCDANRELNLVFEKLIPNEQRTKRFQGALR